MNQFIIIDIYMKSISEKEKKLLETLDKLKNIDIIKPDKIIELENLANQKNQLEIEKKEIEEKKMEDQFSEKIDELNQETDSLMEEIDKWQM